MLAALDIDGGCGVAMFTRQIVGGTLLNFRVSLNRGNDSDQIKLACGGHTHLPKFDAQRKAKQGKARMASKASDVWGTS